MKHLKTLTEVIKLDIKVGDVVLGGRFKNKKIKVKKIGKNKKGDLCINGKPLLRFRIVDQEKINEKFKYHGTLGISKTYDKMVKLAEEIDDEIMYILNDVGVYPTIDIRYDQGGTNGSNVDRSWIDINFNFYVNDIVSTEEYLEFLDRVNDIAKLHSCEVANSNGGYILIYDPKTVDKKRWSIPMTVMESKENKFSINNLQKEIEELNYILEDENVPYRFYTNSGMGYGQFIVNQFDFPITGRNSYEDNEKLWKKLLKSDFFIEYLSHIEEIAKKYDYDIFIFKEDHRIHIVSPHYIRWKDKIKYNLKDKILNQ